MCITFENTSFSDYVAVFVWDEDWQSPAAIVPRAVYRAMAHHWGEMLDTVGVGQTLEAIARVAL